MRKANTTIPMKEEYLLYGALILIIGVLVFSFTGLFTSGPDRGRINQQDAGNAPSDVPAAAATATASFKSITTGSTGPGEVSIELRPHEAKDGKLEVDISANTHSVDLSQFDLKQITTLEYDGKKLRPFSAPALSGHHASGTLLFDVAFNAEKDSEAFTITITGIPKVEERVFAWP